MNGCESKLNYPVSSATAAGWRSRRRAFWNIGRERKLRRADVVSALGEDSIRRIYRYADTFHCEQIAKVADDFITLRSIPSGDFDNVAKCRYAVPGYWDIGAVYARLIEDASQVFVMSHRYADLDGVGAAAGIACIARALEQPVRIVADPDKNAAGQLIETLQRDVIFKHVSHLLIAICTHHASRSKCI